MKAAWPDCRITWLVGEVSAELLKYNPDIDDIIIWSRERFEKHLKNFDLKKAVTMWNGLRNDLASKAFYAALDIQGLFLTGMIASLVKTGRRIGLSETREFNSLFMTETAKPLGKHIIDRYLGVLRPLGITSFTQKTTLIVPEEARRFANDFLTSRDSLPGNKYAVLVPGTTWHSKNWPVEFFAQTARLLGKDFRIILCGGKAELQMGLDIQTKAGIALINAINKTSLLDMAALIEKAAVLVAGDTGPLYIAAALGVPTVSIFGPTNPTVFAPPGARSAVLFSKRTCSFCHKTACAKDFAECMNSVTPGEVVQKVYSVAGRPPARSIAIASKIPGRIE